MRVSTGHATPTLRSKARPARGVALIVLVTLPLWLLLSWVGGVLGLPARFAFLVDLAALSAFAWAMVVLYHGWRARRMEGS